MWHVHNVVRMAESRICREYSFGKRDYPCVEISCQVFRRCGYYHWNALLPILLITLCALTPFLLDHAATASRLGRLEWDGLLRTRTPKIDYVMGSYHVSNMHIRITRQWASLFFRTRLL